MTEHDRKVEEFESIAIPHMGALYSFAYRMLADSDEAQDLVQETYLKAFRFFDSFERGTNCKAWLFRILKNSYINRFRKLGREPQQVDMELSDENSDNQMIIEAKSTETENLLFENALNDHISNAIDALPSEFRTVVILCDIEGLTYEETALFVDCPVGTVRSRLHRARKLLAQSLKAYACERGYNVGEADE